MFGVGGEMGGGGGGHRQRLTEKQRRGGLRETARKRNRETQTETWKERGEDRER